MLTYAQMQAAVAMPACAAVCVPTDPSSMTWSVVYYETDGLPQPTFAACLINADPVPANIVWGVDENPAPGYYTVIWGSRAA